MDDNVLKKFKQALYPSVTGEANGKVLNQDKIARAIKKHTVKYLKFQGTSKYIIMTDQIMS